jgi:hypothetical protein
MTQIKRTGIMGPSARAYMRRIPVHFYISLTAKGREITTGAQRTERYAKVTIHTRGRQNKGDPISGKLKGCYYWTNAIETCLFGRIVSSDSVRADNEAIMGNRMFGLVKL